MNPIRISGAGYTEMGMSGSNREGRGIIAPLDSTRGKGPLPRSYPIS